MVVNPFSPDAPPEIRDVQPTTFELVINPKTAKAQGIDIPPSMRAPTR